MTLDCQTCGACCTSPFGDVAEPFVAVTRADVARLGRERERRLVVVDHRSASGRGLVARHAACAALEGLPGREVRCTIYDARPDACRAVEPGGAYCLESRARLGLLSPGS